MATRRRPSKLRTVIDAEDKTKKGFKSASKNVKTYDLALKNAAAAAVKTVAAIGALAAGAAAVVFVKSVKASREFAKALAEVSTLVDTNTTDMKGLRAEALRLSGAFGGKAVAQVQGLYQAISAGATDAFGTLEAANKLAIGGATDVTTAIDGLTNVTNAYAATGAKAADVSDVFFTAIKAGKTTAAELSQQIGNVAATAAGLNIEFDELFAATAAGSTTLGNATSVITGLKGAFKNIIKPTARAKIEAERLGIEFNQAALRAKGLKGFLDSITGSSEFTNESISKLFNSTEALNTITALTANNGAKFAEVLDQMENRGGAAEEAFNKMSGTLDFSISRFGAATDAALVTFGTIVSESNIARGAVDIFTDAINEMTKGLASGAAEQAIDDALRLTIKLFGEAAEGVLKFTQVIEGQGLTIDGVLARYEALNRVVETMLNPIDALIRRNEDMGTLMIETATQTLSIYTGWSSDMVTELSPVQQILKDVGDAAADLTAKTDAVEFNPRFSSVRLTEKEAAQTKTEKELEKIRADAEKRAEKQAAERRARERAAERREADRKLEAIAREKARELAKVQAFIDRNAELAREAAAQELADNAAAELDRITARRRESQAFVAEVKERNAKIKAANQELGESVANDLAAPFVAAFGAITDSNRNFLKEVLSGFGSMLSSLGSLILEFIARKAVLLFLDFITGGLSGFVGNTLFALGDVLGLKKGGPVGFAGGGMVPGSGSGDTVPAMLTPGEFVLPKNVVNAIRFGQEPPPIAGPQQFAHGGLVGGGGARTVNLTIQSTFLPSKADLLRLLRDEIGPGLIELAEDGHLDFGRA